jgi:hypothetical protein
MSRGSRLALALALACAGAPVAKAEEPKSPARPVRPRIEQMREQMRESQRKLDELVAKMNAATGEARVDAIAAVVTELVTQRRAMMSPGPGGAGMGRMRPDAEAPAQ